jgi:hypothetical protein
MTERSFGKVIGQAWSDEDFKRKLVANPAQVLRDHGLPIPDGVDIKVVEDTPMRRTLVIPPAPSELSDQELDKVAAAAAGAVPPGAVPLAPSADESEGTASLSVERSPRSTGIGPRPHTASAARVTRCCRAAPSAY